MNKNYIVVAKEKSTGDYVVIGMYYYAVGNVDADGVCKGYTYLKQARETVEKIERTNLYEDFRIFNLASIQISDNAPDDNVPTQTEEIKESLAVAEEAVTESFGFRNMYGKETPLYSNEHLEKLSRRNWFQDEK